jgi:uncharacterized membrane protein YcaP (DUF421 family)
MGPTVFGTHVIDILIRTFIIYVVLLAGLRLGGKREIGQFTLFDLVVILLIANAVQNAMVGQDTTLLGGIVAAVVLLAANYGFAFLIDRSRRLRSAMLGKPTVLVTNGEMLLDHMKQEGITQDELEAAVREHGIASIPDVQMAMLEIDGSISIVGMDNQVRRTRPTKRARFIQRRG